VQEILLQLREKGAKDLPSKPYSEVRKELSKKKDFFGAKEALRICENKEGMSPGLSIKEQLDAAAEEKRGRGFMIYFLNKEKQLESCPVFIKD